jgi:hypothetical protein
MKSSNVKAQARLLANAVLNAKRRNIFQRAVKILDESHKKVDAQKVRVDNPHFAGDQKHVHVPLRGGHEASWNFDNTRRHQNKFPSSVPKSAKTIAAQKIGTEADLLESLLNKKKI